jgi:hypothetical protein
MDKSKSRASDSRIDVRFPLDILAAIEAIAVAEDAPVHHISKKPILTPTVIRLVRIGLASVGGDYGLELSDKTSEVLSGSSSNGINKRIDAIEGELADLKKLISELSDKSSDNNPISTQSVKGSDSPSQTEIVSFAKFCEMIDFKPRPGASKSPRKQDGVDALKWAEDNGFSGWRFDSSKMKFIR